MGKRVALFLLLCLIIGTTAQKSCLENAASAPEPDTMLLSFVGDIMAHSENTRTEPHTEAFALIASDLGRADLTFANFEFVIDPERPVAGYPRFNAPVSYVEAAILAGVDVVSLANNHSFDLGVEGVIQSEKTMANIADTYGISYSGVVADPRSSDVRFEVTTIESNGLSIGFLAVTSFINRLIRTDYVNIADYKRADDRAALLEAIRATRDDFDLFVLSYHGGIEYSSRPDPLKASLFTEAVEAGADIVWGHHPHVLQPWERYTGTHHSGFIMYSLGNFLSGQSSHFNLNKPDDDYALRGESVIVNVTLALDVASENDGNRVEIISIDVQPIFHFPDQTKIVRVVPADRLEEVDMSPRWSAFLETRRRHLAEFLEAHVFVASAR